MDISGHTAWAPAVRRAWSTARVPSQPMTEGMATDYAAVAQRIQPRSLR